MESAAAPVSSASSSQQVVPMYDGYLVVSVTSNSDSRGSVRKPEVVELCAVLLDAYVMLPVAEFHSLVLPSAGPALLPAVEAAVGFTSAQLTSAPNFAVVRTSFQAWFQAAGFTLDAKLTALRSCCLVAAGATDIARLVRQQGNSGGGGDAAAPAAAAAEDLFTNWTGVFKVHTMLFHKKAKTLDEATQAAIARAGLDSESPILRPTYQRAAATPAQKEVRQASLLLAVQLCCGATPDPCNGVTVHVLERPVRGVALLDAPLPVVPLTEDPSAAAVALTIASSASSSSAAPAAAVATQASPSSGSDERTGVDETSDGATFTLAPPLALRSTRRTPAQDILAVEPLRPTIRHDEIWAATRKLAILLRTKDLPASGVTMTVDGFCLLDAVLAHPRMNQVQRSTVAHICHLNERQRFSLVYGADGAIYIRANFGHQFGGVEVGGFTRVLTPEESNGLLGVVGTNLKHWPSISRGGVNRLARPAMNLARCDTWKARDVVNDTEELVKYCKMAAATNRGGIRCGASCFILIDVGALIREGGAVVSLVGDGTIFTTLGLDGGVIPPDYFIVVADANGREIWRRSAANSSAAAVISDAA